MLEKAPQASSDSRFLTKGFYMYELLPIILGASHLKANKDARILAAIALVAAGYAGDMDEVLCNELLDDIDYHFNKVKCRKVEGLMPRLMKMAESEMEGIIM